MTKSIKIQDESTIKKEDRNRLSSLAFQAV